jgi:hypothetical protein
VARRMMVKLHGILVHACKYRVVAQPDLLCNFDRLITACLLSFGLPSAVLGQSGAACATLSTRDDDHQ